MATSRPSEQYFNQLRARYRKERKKERGRILDEFVATTGYHRKHAIALLRGKRQDHNPKVSIRHPRRRIYTDEDKRAILWLVELFGQIVSKRLRVAMDVELEPLRQQHHVQVSRVCFQQLQAISPSTMYRLRRAERPPGHRHSGTEPGTPQTTYPSPHLR